MPRFDADSVWVPDYDLIANVCGVDRLGLAPYQGHADCIAQAVQEDGASQSAVTFLNETEYFLTRFEEHGVVDSGLASALWYNMSRPTPLFLDAVPDILFVDQVIPTLWDQDERYAAVLQRALDAYDESIWIWPEYAVITPLEDGEFLVSYPLQSCRPCDVRARLHVRLVFDPHGILTDQELLPPILG